MRECFIHIGTHKTGTTSLQTMLAGCGEALARRGFIYPRTGIPSWARGHHNIAFELGDNPLFRPEVGTAQALLAEIDGCDRHIILSSEDFECLLWRPARFEAFLEALRQRSVAITFVVYFRNQADYARSLYLELLQHGYDGDFNHFISSLLEQRGFSWKSWVFAFDYPELLDQLPAEARLIARAYDPASGVTADFLNLLGLTPADLGVRAELRENPQPPVSAAFGAFYRNRTGRLLDAQGSWITPVIAAAFDGADMDGPTRAALAAAFGPSNNEVERRYGVGGLNEVHGPWGLRQGGAKGGMSLEVIFSAAMVRLIEAADPSRPDRREALLRQINQAAST